MDDLDFSDIADPLVASLGSFKIVLEVFYCLEERDIFLFCGC